MIDWQPIDSAPKDGSVLLYWPRYDDEHPTVFWDTQSKRWRVHCCGQTVGPEELTHWAHLPSGPYPL